MAAGLSDWRLRLSGRLAPDTNSAVLEQTLLGALPSRDRLCSESQTASQTAASSLSKLGEFASRIFSLASESSNAPESTGASQTEFDPTTVDLVRPVELLLIYARRELRKTLSAMPNAGLEDAQMLVIEADAINALDERLKNEFLPTLVVLHDETVRGRCIDGTLAPAQLSEPARHIPGSASWLQAFFARYPVHLWSAHEMIAASVAATVEFANRLRSDLPALHEHLAVARSSSLIRVTGAVGDLHCGGRGVQILHFSAGERVVYKPRPVGSLVAFAGLMHWAKDAGFLLFSRCPNVVDRGEYGWVEFIAFAPCTSSGQIEDFYRRQGANLAWLYFLGAIDLLGENIIAHGAMPYLIDLECLLTPRTPLAQDNLAQGSPGGIVFGDSVIRTGLVPVRSIGTYEQPGPNLSGLSRSPDRQSEGGANNRHLPHLGRAPAEVAVHATQVLDGFTAAYRFVLANKNRILDQTGPLAAFKNLHLRILFRHTSVYSMLAQQARFPEYLGDSVETDKLFVSLWNAHDLTEMPDRIIRSEFDQMCARDIPYFCTRSDSLDVLDGSGTTLVSNFFVSSAMDCTFERIGRACDDDIATQIEIIERAFAIFEPGPVTSSAVWCPLAAGNGGETVATAAELTEAARAIGDVILENAIRGDDDISWIDTNVGRLGEWEVGSKPPGLYDGLEGIGLFLAYLHRASPGRRLHEAVLSIARHSSRELRRLQHSPRRFVHTGWISPMVSPVSTMYLWEHLFALKLVDDEALEVRQRCLQWIEQELQNDRCFDLMLGACGAIHVLLDLYERSGADSALSLAVRCGAHLLSNRIETLDGSAWEGPVFRRLGGFAHGTASFSWTFFRLGQASGQAAFKLHARESLRFDRSLFSDTLGAWCDNRYPDEERPAFAWCHGSAGIGLGRLLSLPYCRDDAFEREIDLAISHIATHGFPGSHGLCHGQLGSLEILSALARHRGNAELQHRVLAHLSNVVRTVRAGERWKCEIGNGDARSYGLFMGLSGIGYGLLRFADWQGVPSVLALEGPLAVDPGGRGCLH